MCSADQFAGAADCSQTDVVIVACRMNFNQAEEEYMDGEDTIGLGTLGKEGSGR